MVEPGPTVEQLRVGVHARRSIGIAMGMLMERHGIDQADAFSHLFQTAREQNRRVSAVADEVINGRGVATVTELAG
ncbi:MAG: ANTAR domain-containing protein [Actinomycetales bacterium]|nr:MAG: ANTAR domain-containing protein [Actinomycetales bacterium]